MFKSPFNHGLSLPDCLLCQRRCRPSTHIVSCVDGGLGLQQQPQAAFVAVLNRNRERRSAILRDVNASDFANQRRAAHYKGLEDAQIQPSPDPAVNATLPLAFFVQLS